MNLFKAILSTLIIGSLGACTMVKSPQSANFQRVKYNSHLKLAKKDQNQKLEPSLNQSLQTQSLEPKSFSSLELPELNSPQPLMVKLDLKPKATTKVKLMADKSYENSTNNINKRDYSWDPLNGVSKFNEDSAEALNSMQMDLTEGEWGNLLYILVAVILVLLIISLLANLAGGLIGALIAILLILLILRILGYV